MVYRARRLRDRLCTITMAHPKNLNNSKTINQARHADPRLCLVLAALRVRNRDRCFNDHEHFPLAIYGTSKKTSSFITNIHITIYLQAAATAAHGVTSRSELKRWCTHSICVGACVLLSKGDQDAPFIKTRLRWKSDTYRDFLRNTSFLASQHSAVVQQHLLS